MKNAWIALLGLVLTVPAWSQEQPAAEPAPAEAAPAETPPPAPDAAPADAAPAEPAPAPAAEAAPAEAPPAEAAAPAEAAEAPREPWPVYAALGYARTKVSSSGAGSLGTADYNSKFLDVRVGKRLFEAVGLEFHYGLDMSDFEGGQIATDRYYGLFIVPTATVFEMVELAFPVGYGRGEYNFGKNGAVSKSVAFGFNAELPLRSFGESYPDIRFTAGWMVWNQTAAARVYGPSFGARYDFTVPNPGNPFSGLGGWYKAHMPGWLGGGDSAAEAPPAS